MSKSVYYYKPLLKDDSAIEEALNQKAKDQPKLPIWKNSVSDIWFATKSSEFMFNQKPVNEIQNSEDLITNFWGDILFLNSPPDTSLPDDKPSKVIERILKASSFKLNWVVDPFARTGGIGKISKRMLKKEN